MNRRAIRTVEQIEGWLTLLRLIRSQVDCYALPISKILVIFIVLCHLRTSAKQEHRAQEEQADGGKRDFAHAHRVDSLFVFHMHILRSSIHGRMEYKRGRQIPNRFAVPFFGD